MSKVNGVHANGEVGWTLRGVCTLWGVCNYLFQVYKSMNKENSVHINEKVVLILRGVCTLLCVCNYLF